MKHVLSFFTAIVMMVLLTVSVCTDARSSRDDRGKMTLKSQMEVIHQTFGVNFIYDSSIDLDIPYNGPSMKSLTDRRPDPSDPHPRSDRGFFIINTCLR